MSAPLSPEVRRALRSIPKIIARDGHATNASVAAELDLDLSELRTVIAILYRQKRVDRIGEYLVAPAEPQNAARQSGRAA